MKRLIAILLMVMVFLTGCSNLGLTPPPKIEDQVQDILWVGDDQILTGPLDMQTILLLEIGGITELRQMKRIVSPRFTLTSVFDESEFLKNIDIEKVDLVIIQAFGINRDFTDQEFMINAKSWLDYFQIHQKQVLIFYPWFSKVEAESEKVRLDRLIHQLVWEEGLTLIPVGPTWQTTIKKNPEINLFGKDGIHPSAEGVYLSACVFFASFTGESPVDLPVSTSVGFDAPDEIVKLDGEIVYLLQKYTWETINDYLQKEEFNVIIKE